VSDQELLRQLRAHCGVYWHGHSVGGTNPSLLEAMGCGAPIVAVDTVYNREVLRRPEQVRIAEDRSIASALQDVLADADARRHDAETAQVTVAENYRWTEVCSQYATALRRLARASLGS
jgi:glycosyltransferase involved in cell wall biosynthesis